jgi:hypothetical protein
LFCRVRERRDFAHIGGPHVAGAPEGAERVGGRRTRVLGRVHEDAHLHGQVQEVQEQGNDLGGSEVILFRRNRESRCLQFLLQFVDAEEVAQVRVGRDCQFVSRDDRRGKVFDSIVGGKIRG